MDQGEHMEYSLRWNDYENNICCVLESMLKRGFLVDVTLSTQGRSHQCHKTVLSACSPYFEQLFTATDHSHPIIILKDCDPEEIQALITFMYTGRVTVSRSKLASFLKTAESLQIRGLINPEQSQPSAETSPALYNNVDDSCIPLRKRKRKFSTNMDHIHHQPFQNDIDKNCSPEEPTEPTDLSLPKGNNEVFFQPVIQAVSYSAVDPTNSNHSSKIYLKPKEALISPPPSEMSEVSSERSSHEQIPFPPLLMDDRTDSRLYEYNVHVMQETMPNMEERRNEPGTSFTCQSDNEDIDPIILESEAGASMVRSGICNVCGCFRSDLRQHMDSHSGQSFKCHICGRAYPRRKTLNQHIKRSHPGPIAESNSISQQ